MAKQILFNEEARGALKKGIDKLAEAVKMTLGPRGRAVVIEKGYGAPQVTFDGVTVAKEIELEGKYLRLFLQDSEGDLTIVQFDLSTHVDLSLKAKNSLVPLKIIPRPSPGISPRIMSMVKSIKNALSPRASS